MSIPVSKKLVHRRVNITRPATITRRAIIGGALAAGAISSFGGIKPSQASGFNDGSSSAPIGVHPQFPTLFTGLTGTVYPVRPPWKVAGVDYGVGPAAATIFKTYPHNAGSFPSGVSWNPTHGIILDTSTNPNITLDGWDFSSGGVVAKATGVHIGGSGSATIRNCIFGPWGIDATSSGGSLKGITIEYCEFNGGGRGTGIGAGTLCWVRGGRGCAITLQHNYIHHYQGDFLGSGPTTGDGNWDVRYNCAFWCGYTVGAHSDFFQPLNGYSSCQFEFNTAYQPKGDANHFPLNANSILCFPKSQGLAANSCKDLNMNFNTGVSIGFNHINAAGNPNTPGCSTCLFFDVGDRALNGFSCANNYIGDVTGPNKGMFWPWYPSHPGEIVHTGTLSNNISLVDGAHLGYPW